MRATLGCLSPRSSGWYWRNSTPAMARG